MTRYQVRLAAALLLSLVFSPSYSSAEQHSEVEGTVRDVRGVPQMGAIIELMGVGPDGTKTAVTGIDGRFLFENLRSGTYRLRASASFLRTVSRAGLKIAVGTQAVVNLTLPDIYDAAAWLPAQRRRASDPEDDWAWTMRSAASRPVLRFASSSQSVPVDSPRHRSSIPVWMSISSGSNLFGASTLEQAYETGFQAVDGTLRISGGMHHGVGSSDGAQPYVVRVGVQRQLTPSHRVSTKITYGSTPEVQSLNGGQGMQSIRVGSADQINLGDTLHLEVGGGLVSDPLRGGALVTQPFSRSRVTLPDQWSVEYVFTTDRMLQGGADAEATIGAETRNVAVSAARVERGHHNALLVRKRGLTRSVHFAWYRDDLTRTPLVGTGTRSSVSAVLRQLGIEHDALFDQANNLFQAEAPASHAQGCQIALVQSYAAEGSVEFSVRSGSGLEITPSQAVGGRVRSVRAFSVGVSTRREVRRTGTELRASYQWQPERLLTPIDPFDVVDVPAYLGMAVQQALPRRLAPRGTVLSISAVNLLRQGLLPVRSVADGSTATFAQQLPSLQAGLGFSF